MIRNNNYIEISSKVFKGEWECIKDNWDWYLKFNHPKFQIKEFKDSLEYFDDNQPCTDYSIDKYIF